MKSSSRYVSLLTLLIGLSSSFLLQSQSRISAVVIDSLTGEGLPFANIQSDGELLTTADAGGYFNLTEAVLPDSIYISYVGYRRLAISLKSLGSSSVNQLRMTPDSELPTVEITLPKNTYGPSSSILVPSVTELARIPALAGEVDLLKSLALLPGISNAAEGSAALNIRGGNPNQTDLLIDGNRVYNVNHIGGFLSAVPAFGTKALTVYKGGVPARYGGRLSGVVDITLREGRRDQLAKTFTVGFGTLQAGIEGPTGSSGSFLINGRYSYPTIIYNLANSSLYERYERGYHQTVGLYDFVGKINQDIGDHHQLTFSAFVSGDRGFDQSDLGTGIVSDDYVWGNRSFTLSHQYCATGGGVWTNSLQYLNYGYAFDARQLPRKREGVETTTAVQTLENRLHDLVARTEFTQPLGGRADVGGGIIATQHLFHADVLDVFTNEREASRFERSIDQDAAEVAVYATANLRFLDDRLNIMGGVRATGIRTVLPRNIEPRLRLAYNVLEELYINASLDRHYQYIHQLTPEIAIYPNELYLLADERLPAERSDQLAVGVGGLHGNLQWSVEAFRKELNDLVRLRPGQERDENFIEVFPENVIGNGEGRVKGLEFYLKRDAEKFSYSLAYTLSKSERRYTEVNQGNWFPFTFDRRHDIAATLSKRVGDKWRANASFVYQTGYSFTAPIYTTAFFDVYGAYNGARLTPFHLLNLSATKSWRGRKRDNRYHTLTFSLYNAYNRANAYSVELIPSSKTVVDQVTGEEVIVSRLQAVSLSFLPIIPGVNYSVTIK